MSLDYDDRRDLLSRTINMVRDFLMDEVYHDTDINQLADEWGVTPQRAESLTTSNPPIMLDLLHTLSLTLLDFGVVIRDPSTGKEVTFFAADNLTGDTSEIRTEEIQYYGSDKKGDDPLSDHDAGLDFLPKINSRVILYDADGNEISNKSVEIDGSFDIDEAELSEITKRDIEEFSTKCENCLDEQRLPDSALCFNCDALGIECTQPEEPERSEDYEPLELMAIVRHHNRSVNFQTNRLLKAGNLLKKETS